MKTSEGRPKLLTIKLPLDMYSEFAAASVVFRERTMTALVHDFVRTKIRQAKSEVSNTEWNAIVSKCRHDIEVRSKIQQKASKKGKVAVKTIELAKSPANTKRRHG